MFLYFSPRHTSFPNTVVKQSLGFKCLKQKLMEEKYYSRQGSYKFGSNYL